MSSTEQAPASYSREEAADRAGVPVGVVDDLVALGFLRPGADDRLTGGDVRRIVVGQTLADAGIPLDTLAQVTGRGEASLEFLDSPLYARFSMLSTTTFRRLAEQTGIPVESLLVIREAIGGAVAEPDDLVREDELLIVPMLEVIAGEGFDMAGGERLLRAMGDGMRRITDAQAEWWQAEVPARFAAVGGALGDLGNATLEFGSRVNRAYWDALTAIGRAHEQRTWTANILETIEAMLTRAGLYRRIQRFNAPPSNTRDAP
jgi:hypothetical protein